MQEWNLENHLVLTPVGIAETGRRWYVVVAMAGAYARGGGRVGEGMANARLRLESGKGGEGAEDGTYMGRGREKAN